MGIDLEKRWDCEKDNTFGIYGALHTFESPMWRCPTGKWVNEYEAQMRSRSRNKFVSFQHRNVIWSHRIGETMLGKYTG